MKLLAYCILALTATAPLYPQAAPVDTLADPVIAVVFGKELRTGDGNRLSKLIFTPLVDSFVEKNHLEPTPAELDTFNVRMVAITRAQMVKAEEHLDTLRLRLKSTSLTEEERAGLENSVSSTEKMLQGFRDLERLRAEGDEATLKEARETATLFVRSWKVNHALHAKYGGRVIFQQMGPEPLDAYRKFLEEEEKKGSFRIIDTAWSEQFWRYFVHESMHSFYPKDEGDKLMKEPWWMKDPSEIE